MYKILILSSIFILLFTTNICSQSNNQPLIFAKITNSPRAVGMGGVTANLVDAQSALYNPGAYGIFSLDNNFSISLPSSTKWLEQLADDLRLQTWSVGSGYSHIKSHQEDETQFKYAIGIAYSKKVFDYGTILLTDINGNPIQPFNPKDQINSFTLSVGLEYYLKIGIGYTHKKYDYITGFSFSGDSYTPLKGKGSMYDFGLLIEFPLHQLFHMVPSDENNMNFEITPSLSFVKSNLGDNIGYSVLGNSGQTPKTRKVGFGLDLNMLQNSKNYLSFQFVYEKEKDLVIDKAAYVRKGLEIGLLNSVFIRSGKVEDLLYQNSDYSSYGVGFSLRGFLTAISSSNNHKGTIDAMGYILKNIDVKFDWAKINEKNSLLDNTKFIKLSITI